MGWEGGWMVGTAQGGRPRLAREVKEADRRVARTPNPPYGPRGSQPALAPQNPLAASALPAARAPRYPGRAEDAGNDAGDYNSQEALRRSCSPRTNEREGRARAAECKPRDSGSLAGTWRCGGGVTGEALRIIGQGCDQAHWLRRRFRGARAAVAVMEGSCAGFRKVRPMAGGLKVLTLQPQRDT